MGKICFFGKFVFCDISDSSWVLPLNNSVRIMYMYKQIAFFSCSIELWLRIQLGKETAVCPYDGILPRHKRKWSTDTCYDVDKPRKCYAKWEKADMKGHTMYDSIYMKCPEWVNPWRQNANWWLPGTVRRENGDNCLMDAGFSSAVIKMFWNWIEVVVVQRPGTVHFEMS